jgi:YjbE family integral membrane protein
VTADFGSDAATFLQVVFIDTVLAGDNAIVVAMAAAGVPKEHRRKVILGGIGAALVLRILLALMATRLLDLVGLTLAGGLLLLWVCWKMFREVVEAGSASLSATEDAVEPGGGGGKSMGRAVGQILAADISMSLDNILAVAGAARDHPRLLVMGLLLSIALMGAAASLIAELLTRHRWIAWIGLAVIFYVALMMIWTGGQAVAHSVAVI